MGTALLTFSPRAAMKDENPDTSWSFLLRYNFPNSVKLKKKKKKKKNEIGMTWHIMIKAIR